MDPNQTVIFNKDSKEQLDIPGQCIKPQPLSTYTKISLKWTIDLNVRAKTSRNYSRKSVWYCVRQRILWKEIEGTHYEEKIDKLDLIKMCNFCLLKHI